MSNWFYQQQRFTQRVTPKTRFGLAVYLFFAFLLTASGVWLLNCFLTAEGLHPFKPEAPEPLNDRLHTIFTPSVTFWSKEIEIWAEQYDLDPLLIATVMQIESCGDPNAVSNAGAQGLFQVMPFHFEQHEDMLDPHINAQRGLAYLRNSFSLARGDIERTLAGYNGGLSRIEQPKSLWPDETLRYTNWGSGIYHEAVIGAESSKTLRGWLEAGGWRLCQQAEENMNSSFTTQDAP